MPATQDPPASGVRLDKWLWAARFFKTRAAAAQAIAGGKVELNDQKPKRARSVHPGDRLRIRLGPQEFCVAVLALAERRGSAAAASALYQEDEASRVARERQTEQRRLARDVFGHGLGRPTKRQRREIRKLKGD